MLPFVFFEADCPPPMFGLEYTYDYYLIADVLEIAPIFGPWDWVRPVDVAYWSNTLIAAWPIRSFYEVEFLSLPMATEAGILSWVVFVL